MFNFDILVNERPVKRFFDSQGRIWIEARPGSSFSLKVSNNSYGRILAVVSVDGLNVIDGKHEDPWCAKGYIVNSFSNINIPGWKINSCNVREFYFTIDENQSYSRKIGADERNIGVIGAAIFTEKLYNQFNYTYSSSDCNSFYPDTVFRDAVNSSKNLSGADYNVVKCSCNESPYTDYSEKVSVGSGETKDFKTFKTNFERLNLYATMSIYYETWEGLKRKGILKEDEEYRNFPKPFPDGKYCPNI
jgi:hypothetical protein